jgi:ribonuclease HII
LEKNYIFIKNIFMLIPNFSSFDLECGTDEAGRGCLAGPVTAAAVVLFPTLSKGEEEYNVATFFIEINDSKQLSEKTREKLRPIIEKIAISFSVTHIEPQVIDEINILNASIDAMQQCIMKLKPLPNYIIVDGNCPLTPKGGIYTGKMNRFSEKNENLYNNIPYTCIIKGDSKYLSIAAASVLAKTYRDEYMNKIHEEFPMYNWKKNKGYPTAEHREAIRKYGVTKYHRMSFRLLPESSPQSSPKERKK